MSPVGGQGDEIIVHSYIPNFFYIPLRYNKNKFTFVLPF
jgi:hypothetical protein